jgi:hypothetical protein
MNITSEQTEASLDKTANALIDEPIMEVIDQQIQDIQTDEQSIE